MAQTLDFEIYNTFFFSLVSYCVPNSISGHKEGTRAVYMFIFTLSVLPLILSSIFLKREESGLSTEG